MENAQQQTSTRYLAITNKRFPFDFTIMICIIKEKEFDMAEEKKYCVYTHEVETENGKMVYVGMTSMKLSQRWKPSAYSKQAKFGTCINKYGWENIKHNVIVDGLTREEALKMEDKMICEYREKKCSLNQIRSGLVQSDKEYVKQRSRKYYYDNHEHYRAYRKQYYIDNKEEILKNNKEYHENHKDTIKGYQDTYREEHREYNREYAKKYREGNKDKVKETNREQYLKNREKRIECAKKYYQEHREEINARRRKKKQQANDKEAA